MKKVLLFALLFTAGLSILRWIEHPVAVDPVEARDEPRVPRQPPIAPPEVTPKPEPSQVAVPGGDSSESGFDVQISGPVRTTKRVEEGPFRGRKRYHLESADSRSLGSGYVELFDLWAVAYDPETGEELLRIQAAKGRAAVNHLFEEEIALSDVELTLLRNAPIVPLTLRAPTLTGSLQDSQFHTDARVSIDGQGLVASGTGFEFVIAGGLLGFHSDGHAEVETESGRHATLDCKGPFEIRRPSKPGSPVVLDAHESATLALLDAEPVVLDAAHVRIAGRSTGDDDDVLGFESIDADGDVSLRLSGSEFLSDRAQVVLTGAESAFRAEMAGGPHGEFQLKRALAAPGAAPSETPLRPFSIRFSGVGPLVVTRGKRVEFDLPGPSRLSWSDAELRAVDRVQGTFGPGVDEADFGAFGEVVIERENGTLTTPEFHLLHRRDADGVSRVTASATGSARMSGVVDAEHRFVLVAEEEIRFALDGRVWRIPSATGIDLTVDGPRGFVAHARQVTDFAPEPLTLEARGDVSLESEGGSVRGNRMVLHGLDDLRIEGLPDALAHLRSTRGEWFALRVQRVGPTMIAEGVERAIFSDAGAHYELTCDRMVVEELETRADGDSAVATEGFRFVATGSLEGRADYPGDSFEISCEHLEGERIEHLKGETFLYSESNLLARDEVHCEFARNDSEFRLRSDSLAINRTNRGTDTLTSGSLVARGNVDVESLSEARIHGQGDELEVDKFGRGELIAFEGRRIHAEGETPGGRFPFDMTARRLQFSNAFLDASQPEIQLELQSGEDSDEPGIPLRASAERLEAQGDTLSLTGGVHLEGLSQGISPWTLRAESSRISLREARNHKRLDSLEASGDVEFDLQGVLHADGDEFLVKMGQQRLRVAGDPVRVVYRGLDIESSWVEYDLLIHGLSTARDSVFTPATSDEGRNQEP